MHHRTGEPAQGQKAGVVTATSLCDLTCSLGDSLETEAGARACGGSSGEMELKSCKSFLSQAKEIKALSGKGKRKRGDLFLYIYTQKEGREKRLQAKVAIPLSRTISKPF